MAEERLGEMRKGRRERMRKGAIVSSSPQGMTSWSSSIKIWFFQAYMKQNAKICAIPSYSSDQFSVLRQTLHVSFS